MKPILIIALLASGITLYSQEPDKVKGSEPYIFSIYFGGGSYYIDSKQKQALFNWLEEIPDFDSQTITIQGHTDDIGSREYNQWLSDRRCNSAVQKLLDKGIAPTRITIQPLGESNPVYDNATWEGKLRNRRVDIIIDPMIL